MVVFTVFGISYVYILNKSGDKSLPCGTQAEIESRMILNRLIEMQMYSQRGKIRLLNSRELEGIILICIGGHRAKLYHTLGSHLEKFLGNIFSFQIKFEFYQ